MLQLKYKPQDQLHPRWLGGAGGGAVKGAGQHLEPQPRPRQQGGGRPRRGAQVSLPRRGPGQLPGHRPHQPQVRPPVRPRPRGEAGAPPPGPQTRPPPHSEGTQAGGAVWKQNCEDGEQKGERESEGCAMLKHEVDEYLLRAFLMVNGCLLQFLCCFQKANQQKISSSSP